MNKPELIVLVGLSGSGKSTIATEIANKNPNTVIVSSDAIREELTGNYEDQEHNEEVFKVFHDRIRRNLEQKKNVIADATNLTMKSRRAIINKINGLDVYVNCKIISKPFNYCKRDNNYREHPVPDEVLDKQIRRFQIPFYEEGFNNIEIVKASSYTNELYIKKSYYPTLFDMRDFDQKNPHHDLTLGEHCEKSGDLFEELRKQKYEDNNLYYFLEIGLRLGAKFHDIGKMYVQTFDEDGIAHYNFHSEVGSYLFMSEIASNTLIGSQLLGCCFLINYHMLPFQWHTDKIKQRWRERFGEYMYNVLLDFHECDMKASKKG